MPREAHSPAPTGDDHTTTPTPKQRWANYFSGLMAEQNLANKDAVKLLDRPSYDPSMIHNWVNAKSGASVAACLRIAEAFHRAPSEVLRAAGHTDVAEEIERIATGRRSADPTTDPIQMQLDEITEGLPKDDRAEIRARMLASVGDLFDLARYRAEQARRAAAQERTGTDAGSDGVS